MARSTLARNRIAHTNAMHGGSTFHMNMFSIVKAAFEVAVMRLVSTAGRRFEKIGEVEGVLIVDDYAHHPTEIRATLAAARAGYPDRRIVGACEPYPCLEAPPPRSPPGQRATTGLR